MFLETDELEERKNQINFSTTEADEIELSTILKESLPPKIANRTPAFHQNGYIESDMKTEKIDYDSNDKVIELKGVSASWDNSSDTKVIQNISFLCTYKH